MQTITMSWKSQREDRFQGWWSITGSYKVTYQMAQRAKPTILTSPHPPNESASIEELKESPGDELPETNLWNWRNSQKFLMISVWQKLLNAPLPQARLLDKLVRSSWKWLASAHQLVIPTDNEPSAKWHRLKVWLSALNYLSWRRYAMPTLSKWSRVQRQLWRTGQGQGCRWWWAML